MRRIKEWISTTVAKQPGRMVLLAILVFNLAFLFISALIINSFSVDGTEKMGFFEAAFCTLTMILDAGCIQFVIADIGNLNVAVTFICLSIIIIGMVAFTGTVVGYVTNYISGFIENANTGSRKLTVSNHVIILNWNSRASEIINDLLFCRQKQKVVVLVNGRKKEVEKEVNERLSATVEKENIALKSKLADLNVLKRINGYRRERLKNTVTVIVREGDVFSSKQLHDISLEHAKTVIILGNDVNNTVCKYERNELADESDRGNSQTVKTLMQVADIAASDYSDNDQKIIVEITDEWTAELVDKIIKYKQISQKCHIVPIKINCVLGQILSQFSLMPELNTAYEELFSNKGVTFYASEYQQGNDTGRFVTDYFDEHSHAIPITLMESGGVTHSFYATNSEKNIYKTDSIVPSDYSVELNPNYCIEKKNVIILGHNSKISEIMQGFETFLREWSANDGSSTILNMIIIDDPKSIAKMDEYKSYPFVKKTIAANIYDKELICSTIEEFISLNAEDTSILILSDDSALNEYIDANALANLIYVQDIINRKMAENPKFDRESIDVIVEIIDPKHHDIVNSYSVNNVVISNRYISKMITQIGKNEALYDFFEDILTYDTEIDSKIKSKEIYAKKVGDLFTKLPGDASAAELVRAVYSASVDPSLPTDKINPTIVLGYVKPGGKLVLFEGNQSSIHVHLESTDKLIVCSDH